MSYSRAGHNDDMAHARFMLDTTGYKHTLRRRNNHCERAIMLRYTYTVCLV